MFNHVIEEEFEETKVVIRSRTSKDRQRNDHKKDERTNNEVQNTTQETKDRATRTPPNTGGELMCSGRVNSFFPTSYNPARVAPVTNPVIRHI